MMRHTSLVIFLKNEFVSRHAPASRLHNIVISVTARITEYSVCTTHFLIFLTFLLYGHGKKKDKQQHILAKMNDSLSGMRYN